MRIFIVIRTVKTLEQLRKDFRDSRTSSSGGIFFVNSGEEELYIGPNMQHNCGKKIDPEFHTYCWDDRLLVPLEKNIGDEVTYLEALGVLSEGGCVKNCDGWLTYSVDGELQKKSETDSGELWRPNYGLHPKYGPWHITKIPLKDKITNLKVGTLDNELSMCGKHVTVGCQKISKEDALTIANKIIEHYGEDND